MTKAQQLSAWVNGTGPRPGWVAPSANLDYIRNGVNNFGADYMVANPRTTENQWWVNTASPNAAASQTQAQAQLAAYISGSGARPAWLDDLPPSQVAGVESLRHTLPGDPTLTAAQKAQRVQQFTVSFLSSGVNSGVYQGGGAYRMATEGHTPDTTGAAGTPGAPGAPGTGTGATGGAGVPGAAGGFTPTPGPAGGSGVADPNQPFGAGFGTDYGLNPASDPNFAFGSGTTAITGTTVPPVTTPVVPPHTPLPVTPTPPPTEGAAAGLGAGMNQALVNYVAGGQQPGFFNVLPAAQQAYLVAARAQLASMPPELRAGAAAEMIAQPPPQVLGGTPSSHGGSSGGGGSSSGSGAGGSGAGGSATGGSGSGGGSSAQQNALAGLTTTLNTYGLGSMAHWAWGEIVAGKSEQQVLLDLMQTPQFKARFPAIAARQAAGLPSISPGEYVSYENQATQMMRAAGLPSGFWDSPADFTHLIAADVSVNELQQRLNLATQAAYQVPAEDRAVLQRDYGVGAGSLAAFFLDDKTALPLIQRDFTAAQIGGAAYRTGYGSTRSEDEHLTDLGVNPGQAQQGFTQLTMQRQLMSSLPGENTSGISRDQQLQATFAGDATDQEKIVRRSQTRVAALSGGGSFAVGGLGAAQGA